MKYRQSQGRILYFILWGGALVIGAGMMIFGYDHPPGEKNLLKNPALLNQKSSGNVINDLLLSADELTISEKNSFISLYLKPGGEMGSITYQIAKDTRDEVYKRIFQRKINKLNGKPSDDFSVKPIPK